MLERKLDCPHELATTAEMGTYPTRQLRLDANYSGGFERIRFDNNDLDLVSFHY